MANRERIVESSFRPTWWWRWRHLQTAWPTLFYRRVGLRPRRERFELDDGDFLDLDWVGGDSGPIVVVLHGLMGSIQSPYAWGLLKQVEQLGWRGLFVHFRGCSAEPNRLPRAYHSGDTGDLAAVIEAMHAREPETPIVAAGFSLGGNALLKWLSETGDGNPLRAAVAVSVPFDIEQVANSIHQGFSRVYERRLTGCLRQMLATKIEQFGERIPVPRDQVSKLDTFWRFDDAVTAPLHGFEDARDYYRKASARQYLPEIRCPTLILHAKDDPFMTVSVIPRADELSESTTLELSERGGHIGFISGGWPWAARYWLEERIPDYLKDYLE